MPLLSDRYVGGEGALNPKLAIVGEAPGFYEDQYGLPFVGPSGNILNEFLLKAGVQRHEVYVTNVIKRRPANNNLKIVPQPIVDESIDELIKELQTVNPNCILALGNLALAATTGVITTNVKGMKGINDWRGSILFSNTIGCKVVPTIHPAALLHDKDSVIEKYPYQARYYVQLDYNRAVEESESKRYDIPKKNVTIIRNSSQLYSILRQFRGRSFVSIDIELHDCFPCSVSLAFDKYNAIAIPLMNISARDWIPIPDLEICRLWKYLDDFFKHEPQLRTIGQNFKFDEVKLKTCYGIYCPPLQYDTSFLAHILNPEFGKSLAFLTSIWTRHPYYKDEGKEFNPKKDRFERFLTYNGIDACITYEICFEILEAIDELQSQFPLCRARYYADEYYPKLHNLYINIEKQGLAIDKEKKAELSKHFDELYKARFSQLENLVGHKLDSKFVNSPKQVAELLYDELKIPERKGTGEDVLVALLGNVVKDGKRRDIIDGILELRRTRKTSTSYINARADYDGRMRTAYRIVGTETGRSSTSIIKPPLRPHKMGLAFQTLTKYGEGSQIRKMFVADKGYHFMNWDLEQAEARIVALLANDLETLKLFDTIDIHAMTAWWIFGGESYKLYCKGEDGTEPTERFIGKTTRHAGNYDMGKRTLMDSVNSSARRFGIQVNISEWRAGKILDAFHSHTPRIREVFHTEVSDRLDESATLINPYGRIRQFFGEPREAGTYREGYAFIPQSTVIDHIRFAALRILERIPDLRICLETHDALTALVKEADVDSVDAIVRQELTKPIDFTNCSLPRGTMIIPAGCEIGYNLKEMKKYRKAA